MSNKHFWSLLIVILFVAAALRFYQLGLVPQGMTWDEAAIGYNGYAIWETRRDEWLRRLPVSFQSFGDYKAPFAIYLSSVFTTILGLNLWAVRLPFALFSLTAIVGIILLGSELFQDKKIGLSLGILLTLSPWHLHYSRAGFESGMALAMMIWGVYLFLVYLKQKKWWWLILSSGLLSLTLYTYHSAKVAVPLFLIYLLWSHRQQILKSKKILLWAGSTFLVLLGPLFYDSFFQAGLTRASTTFFSNTELKDIPLTLIKNWLTHISPTFLIDGATTTLRHGDGRWGVLLPTTYFLALLGAIWGGLKKSRFKPQTQLALVWLSLGLLPAALGQEIPHSNRAILALPAFLLLTVIGLKQLLKWVKSTKLNKKLTGSHGEKQMILKAVVSSLVLIHGLFFLTYLHDYYTRFAADSAADFKDGYIEVFEYVRDREDEVEKILFTSDYGQPYIYALFVRQTNPIWYQGGSLIKYEFTSEIDVGDLVRENTIVVASQEDEIDAGWADKLIIGSDGAVRFKIYLPQDE